MEREPRVSSLSLNIPTAMMASRRKCVGRVLRHCHYEVAGLCCVPPWLASPQTPREQGVKTSLAYGAFQIPGKPEMRGGCGHVTPNCGSVTYQCVKLSVYPHDDHSNTRASTALRARYFYMHTHTHTCPWTCRYKHATWKGHPPLLSPPRVRARRPPSPLVLEFC